MSMREFCETVYCAMAAGDIFAPGSEGRLSCVATTTEHGRSTEHRVVFEAVQGLTRRAHAPRQPELGDRIEFSVVALERTSDGWRVWLNPWYVEEIEFRCTGIQLDGRDVIGEGRWLQDELPSRSAV
jgi:hypothetical protein